MSEYICRRCWATVECICSGYEPPWPLNLAANLAAAGMAATMMGAPCDCYEERGMFSECYVHIARRTMREAVS